MKPTEQFWRVAMTRQIGKRGVTDSKALANNRNVEKTYYYVIRIMIRWRFVRFASSAHEDEVEQCP
jgi:hypothetical protein